MASFYNKVGLSKERLESIIENKLEKNADLMIGIDDPETLEMIDVLKDAMVAAIDQNNKEIENSIEKLLENKEDKRQSFGWRPHL